ncbi:MAG: NYN domain-containing protein, partial [Gemmatimonadetes bacterium]|nr:NYN domain-containing protein [Gemmatimonadota bacterium]
MHTLGSRAPIAPMHRGPQAHQAHQAHQALGAIPAPLVHAPNAALLIDFDNVTMGIRSDLQTELRNLLTSDIIHGKVAVQRAYADWRRYPQYIVPLSEASIDLIFAPAYGSSKKNATDIRLAIDAMELVFTRPEIGTIILLSGDSDFSSLVIKLKEYGKYVIGVGIRESSSDLLVQNCDEYYSYNALAGLVKSGEVELTPKWDPWELVTEAISRMQQNDDVMRSDRLKQVMQEIDGTFDEKSLGHPKFSKFCQEAAHRGLITSAKMENGQLEVGPVAGAKPSRTARVASTGAAASTAEAAPKAEGEGRSRRGRRGGRGRKRGERTDEASAESGAVAAASGASGAINADAGEGSPADAPEVAALPAPSVTPDVAADVTAVESPVSAGDQPEDEGAAAGRPPAPRPPRRRAPSRAPSRATTDESIGATGQRLTRDEAMSLVAKAVAELTTEDETVSDEDVRRKAFELLGRDSESLSVSFFGRILCDAHDRDIVDLRRRGDGFELARAAAAPSVADQLADREKEAKAAEPVAPAAAPAPRGMGPRGAPPRGGRSG